MRFSFIFLHSSRSSHRNWGHILLCLERKSRNTFSLSLRRQGKKKHYIPAVAERSINSLTWVRLVSFCWWTAPFFPLLVITLDVTTLSFEASRLVIELPEFKSGVTMARSSFRSSSSRWSRKSRDACGGPSLGKFGGWTLLWSTAPRLELGDGLTYCEQWRI